MRFIPAIDLLDGRCVRLLKGDFDRVTVYDEDPVARVRAFAAAGATRVHVVDLDAARDADRNNHDRVADIVRGAGVEVQVGGGIRDEGAVDALFAHGAACAVVGTIAVEDPPRTRAIAEAWPGRVYVALDSRRGMVATHGWGTDAGTAVQAVVDAYRDTPLAGFVYTDIDRDGTLTGADASGLRQLVANSPHPVIQSGGVAGVADVVASREAGAWGVIAGRAIYEGHLDIEEAIAAASA